MERKQPHFGEKIALHPGRARQGKAMLARGGVQPDGPEIRSPAYALGAQRVALGRDM